MMTFGNAMKCQGSARAVFSVLFRYCYSLLLLFSLLLLLLLLFIVFVIVILFSSVLLCSVSSVISCTKNSRENVDSMTHRKTRVELRLFWSQHLKASYIYVGLSARNECRRNERRLKELPWRERKCLPLKEAVRKPCRKYYRTSTLSNSRVIKLIDSASRQVGVW